MLWDSLQRFLFMLCVRSKWNNNAISVILFGNETQFVFYSIELFSFFIFCSLRSDRKFVVYSRCLALCKTSIKYSKRMCVCVCCSKRLLYLLSFRFPITSCRNSNGSGSGSGNTSSWELKVVHSIFQFNTLCPLFLYFIHFSIGSRFNGSVFRCRRCVHINFNLLLLLFSFSLSLSLNIQAYYIQC